MEFLLPNKFKKVGLVIAPAGLVSWTLMQRGYASDFSRVIFSTATENFHHSFLVTVAIISFFSFITGMYFFSFSKEKTEDEMIRSIRLNSFQFAALVQLIILISGFACMLFWEPDKEGMLYFFVSLVFIFWLTYLIRFNFILHFRLR